MTDFTLTYLRPKKAGVYRRISGDYVDRTGDLRIDEHEDVVLTPLGQLAGASTDSGLADVIIDDCDFCASIKKSAPGAAVRINGRVLYGGYFRSQWGHFLMNTTSRLWPLFTGAIQGVDKILFFSDNNQDFIPQRGNYREFLELAGILDKVFIVSGAVEVESLIVPEMAFEHTRYFSSEARAVFDAVRESAMETSPGEFSDKVFLTRSSLPGAARDEININKLDELFLRNGYQIVSPEKVCLRQLINILNRAGHIASVSGSTAHNFVFAGRDAEFIIVERTAVVNVYQIGIDLICGISPILIDAYRLPQIAPATGRLFLYGATGQLEEFISARGWSGHTFDCNDKARKKELSGFLKRYKRLYGYSTGIAEWEIGHSEAISEAYVESYAYYQPWLERRVPVLLADYFSPVCLYRRLRRRR
ncbi:MAG: glycosyltransferase family 61 protein [Bacteroides sp.]|nr:glycosyltransferase family 61 protein [Bacteroides sp.]